MALLDRFKGALGWNAFSNKSSEFKVSWSMSAGGSGSTSRPDRKKLRFSNEKSIVSSVYTRIGIDVADYEYRHVTLDEQGRYFGDVMSGLNKCFTWSPNLDQVPRQLRQDIAMTLFDSGCAVVVPVDTDVPPNSAGFDIGSIRVGIVTEWFPSKVRVSLYNEAKGVREEIVLDKRFVAIIENPLYLVMNEPNSTLQRLIRKLTLLDAVDEQSGSGKLDLIIQLPYTIKSEARRNQAEQRRKDIEFQLKDSQYGIAYADATEKITQLNRPSENNLLKQVEFLTNMLYGQLGITEEVMNGTASEDTMINYYNRTIKPILDAIVQAMQKAFLGSANIERNERVMYFYDPFKLANLATIGDMADKFARNEVLTSNEIREVLGRRPSSEPKADKLINSNMPQNESESQSDPIERNGQNGS